MAGEVIVVVVVVVVLNNGLPKKIFTAIIIGSQLREARSLPHQNGRPGRVSRWKNKRPE